jgi:hypothetical protein
LKYLLFLSLFAAQFNAQNHLTTDNYGVWSLVNSNIKMDNHWGVFLMGQVRQSDYGLKQNQLLVQYGLTYSPSKKLVLGAGHALSRYFPFGEFASKSEYTEHRFWEQTQYRTQVQNTEWLSRLRLEHRFLYLPTLIDSQYKSSPTATLIHRFRISTKFSIPFRGTKLVDKSIYYYIADELFLNIAGEGNFNLIDQNRCQLGLGYIIPKVGRLELGYLLQSALKSDNIRIEHNHFIQLALISVIDLRKKKK